MSDNGSKPVGLPLRLVAYLIDWTVLTVIDYALGGVFEVAGVRPFAGELSEVALPTLTGLIYFGYFFSTSGQTLGKSVLGLKVVRLDGRPLDWATGLIRYIGYLFSAMVFFLGFILIAVDPRHQGLHDKLARTTVVRV